MKLKGLILDPGQDVPVIILRSVSGGLLLPIWIGPAEANAIGLALEGVVPPRPLTHDLLKNLLDGLGAVLHRVEVWGLLEGTFHARLRLELDGRRVEIDARPSDAVALALRTRSPVWVSRSVLEGAISAEVEADEDEVARLRKWLENARPEDLGKYKM